MALAIAFWLAAAAPAPLPLLHSPEEILALARGSQPPTVVHFWASWCDACVEELPEIQRLERGLAELGAPLLLISLDPPASSAQVETFLRAHRLLSVSSSRAVLLEAPDPAPITRAFDARWTAQLPATFVVLHSGAVVASHLGTTPVAEVLREVRERLHAPNPGSAAPDRRTQ